MERAWLTSRPRPQLAEQSLMKSAIKTSEESWIEQQMLEDKKRATDWEATNEAIEEQVARESYLQWLRDQEKQARQVRLPPSHAAVGSGSRFAPLFPPPPPAPFQPHALSLSPPVPLLPTLRCPWTPPSSPLRMPEAIPTPGEEFHPGEGFPAAPHVGLHIRDTPQLPPPPI